MRFNAKELAFLGSQPQERFDREGILYLKEKQDGLFRRADVFVERFCRLRGNLLFYFKSAEPQSEPVGLLVLERFTIQFFPACELPHHFVIVFEEDERLQFVAAPSESDRDQWIEALHIASYECMKIQLASLRSEIRAKTGVDPITDPPGWSNIDSSSSKATASTASSNPVLEICVACEDLPVANDDRLPNPVVVVGTRTPPAEGWFRQGQSEIQEKSRAPCFLTTVPFHAVTHATRVRITVYDVRERVSGTMTYLGQAQFPLAELLESPGETLRKRLVVGATQGIVVVKAWQLVTPEFLPGWDESDVVGAASDDSVDDNDESRNDAEADVNSFRRQRSTSSSSSTTTSTRKKATSASGAAEPLKTKRLCLETLTSIAANVIVKTYRLPTTTESELSVYEYMGDSQLTSTIPRLLLDMWIADEKANMEELSRLGRLPGNWERIRVDLIDSNAQLINAYTRSIQDLDAHPDVLFKPSLKKARNDMEFLPTNLQIQRLWVETKSALRPPVGVYDVITVGAFTAFNQGFKNGGLRRLVLSQRETASDPAMLTTATDYSKLDLIRDLLKHISNLKRDVDFYSQSLCRTANQGAAKPLEKCLTSLADKTRQLFQVCENELLSKGVDSLEDAKAEEATYRDSRSEENLYNRRLLLSPTLAPPSPPSPPDGDDAETSSVMTEDETSSVISEAASEDQRWRWTGTGFVKSPTQEPWEISRINVEAALVCVISKAEELVSADAARAVDVGPQRRNFNWLTELAPLVINLQSHVNVMTSRATTSLAFLTVQEHSKMFNTRKVVQHRRDACFSQALTSLTTAFVLKLHSSLYNKTFLRQIFQIGCLAVFESLLSCYGDELAMLEDMVVAVNDLRTVQFKIVSSKHSTRPSPTLTGNRQSVVVTIPLHETLFPLLPREIQRGKTIRVVPVLFSIGINEQATMAEKFGDTSFQELVNVESMSGLNSYYEKFLEVLGPEAGISSGPNSGLALSEIMQHLHHNVLANKSKNVDILHLAGQACREMNGLKFTSCKSAKDRTSMAVTLQQCQILQLHHDLLPKLFLNALDCMRQEGTRLVNVEKNIGFRKYAFNRFKLMTMPKLYRPPHGTYGNVNT